MNCGPAIKSATRGRSEGGSAEPEDMDFSTGQSRCVGAVQTKPPTNSSAAFGNLYASFQLSNVPMERLRPILRRAAEAEPQGF